MIQAVWAALKFLYVAVNMAVCTYAIILGMAYLWATWATRDSR